MKGKLIAEADATQGGWPALDFRYRTPDKFVGFVRAAIVKGKIIEISVTSGSEAAAKAPFDRVVSSLGLAKGVEAGPLTKPGPTFERHKFMDSLASAEFPGTPQERKQPLTDKPGAPLQHIQAAAYANRVYIASYIDIPEEQLPKEDDQIADGIQWINGEVIGSFKGKDAAHFDTTLDGLPAVRTVAKVGDDGTVIVVSSIQDGRFYTLVALVPSIWRDAAEPKGFFDSFKATAATK